MFDDKNNEMMILNPEEAADYLRIGMNTMYTLLNSHLIKACRIGRSWKIPKKSLDEYVMENCCK